MPRACQRKANNLTTMLTILTGTGIDASIVNDVTSEDLNFIIFFKDFQMMSLLLASSRRMPVHNAIQDID
jgi:hypothetical protein